MDIFHIYLLSHMYWQTLISGRLDTASEIAKMPWYVSLLFPYQPYSIFFWLGNYWYIQLHLGENNFFDLLFNRLLLQNQYAEFYRRHDDLFTNWVPQYFIVFIVQWQVAMLCVDKMCL